MEKPGKEERSSALQVIEALGEQLFYVTEAELGLLIGLDSSEARTMIVKFIQERQKLT